MRRRGVIDNVKQNMIYCLPKGVAMAQVNFRIDDRLKAQADAEFRQMGLTFSAAITLLCTQVVLKHKLPFSIEAPTALRETSSHCAAFASAASEPSSGKRFLDFIKANPIDVPADFRWSRAAAHEREMRCLK